MVYDLRNCEPWPHKRHWRWMQMPGKVWQFLVFWILSHQKVIKSEIHNGSQVFLALFTRVVPCGLPVTLVLNTGPEWISSAIQWWPTNTSCNSLAQIQDYSKLWMAMFSVYRQGVFLLSKHKGLIRKSKDDFPTIIVQQASVKLAWVWTVLC